jgi:hypothetical protein
MTFLLGLALSALTVAAAEKRFDFSDVGAGKMPPGFRSLVAGGGKPGDWQVVMDEVPSLLAPLSPQAPKVARRAVLAQVSKDPTDERFPMLAFEGESFDDFTLTTRFKIVEGQAEQMAGIAFRLQDEKNFYVIRASALGRNVRFYKVVDGLRSDPIGPPIDVTNGVWYELRIECKGNTISCALDGREVFPPLIDTSFNAGKLAFWTKSDSVTYFTDTVISYKARIPLAQTLVNEMIQKYPRIQALKIYALNSGKKQPAVIASKVQADLGQPGGRYELGTIEEGTIYFAKESGHVALVLPLRDRNGDIVAAVRVHLDTFPGQTEKNALIRATPIVKEMQARLQSGGKLEE